MKLSKVLSITLAISSVLTLAGCGGKSEDSGTSSEATSNESAVVTESSDSGTSSSEKKTVTVWAWDPNYNILALEEAKKVYAGINPDVEIEIVDYAKADLEQKLHTNLASGQSEGLPDVVLIENLNVIKYMSSYPGAFTPLTGKVNYDDFAAPVDFMTVDGDTYGLPFGSAVAGLYYRRDYLEEAGYSPSDLENITWDEYIEIGTAVTEKTGHPMLTQDPDDGGLLRMMMQSAGSWFFDKDGNIDIKDNKVLAESVSQYKRLMDSGTVKIVSGWSEFVGAFNGGEVVTVPTGCWITPSVIAEESQSGKWGVAPMPRLNIPESINATELGGSSWFVLSSSDVQEESIDFLAKTFGGSVELYDALLTNSGISSMYSPAFSSKAYTEPQPFFADQKIYEDFSNWSEDVKGVNFGMYTWEADAALMGELRNIVNGADISTSLENVQTLVEQQVQ